MLRDKNSFLEKYARFGLVAKGVVYSLIGILTVMAAAGLGGEKADQQEAFQTIYEQPFGKILLVIIAIGLVGYVVLRLFQAFGDTEEKGNDWKGIVTRVGYGISALLYSTLAYYAVRLILQQSSGGNSKQQFISSALDHSAGKWLIGLAGLIIVGNGIRQIYNAVTGKFMKRLHFSSDRKRSVFHNAGLVGYCSRGIVLLIVGYLLLHAAAFNSSAQGASTEGAFNFIEEKFGSVLLALISIGLFAYGVFMFIRARYQPIRFD